MNERRAASVVEHCFVVPPLHGPITGGTLYNRELLGALRAQAGASIRVLEFSAAVLGDVLGVASWVWIDSLWPSTPRFVARFAICS